MLANINDLWEFEQESFTCICKNVIKSSRYMLIWIGELYYNLWERDQVLIYMNFNSRALSRIFFYIKRFLMSGWEQIYA